MKTNLFYFSILALILFSCERKEIIEIEVEEHVSQLAVIANFSQLDSVLSVFLTPSLGILDSTRFTHLPNAKMTLFQENNTIHEFKFSDGVYKTDKINPLGISSQPYTLRVEAPGFETITSEQQMPSATSIISGEVDINATISMTGELADLVTFTFKDAKEEQNFYAIRVTEKINIEGTDLYAPYSLLLRSGLESLDPNIEKGNSELLITDETFNGDEKTLILNKTLKFEDAKELTIELRTVTEEYYLYSKTSRKFFDNQENPFVEPNNVFTNIENGFGVFGLYSASLYSINL